MGSQSEVMHCYEQMVTASERMQLLAHSGQWGELPALEAQNSDTLERLKVIEPLETLDESQSRRKYKLLERIQANYADIHNRVMPQLIHLGEVLKSLEQEQRLHKAYSQSNNALL